MSRLRIKSIGEWFNRKLHQLQCKFQGHQSVRVVEEYKSQLVIRNFKGSSIKKLTRTNPVNHINVWGKLKCGHCGATFIGKVTFDTLLDESHNNPYGTE